MDQIGNKPIAIDLTVRDTAEQITVTTTEDIIPADMVLKKGTQPDCVPFFDKKLVSGQPSTGTVLPGAI